MGRKQPGKKASKKRLTPLAHLLRKILIYVVVIASVLHWVLAIQIHYGNNMFPMIKDGEFVAADRLEQIRLNDAVMYMYDGKAVLGRVIAQSGQVVNITEDGLLTIDGVQPAEEIFYPTTPAASGITYPYTVPEGSWFILNDYRSDTSDSRSFGSVPKEDMIGIVLLTIQRRGF